jgi:hypothetical protein
MMRTRATKHLALPLALVACSLASAAAAAAQTGSAPSGWRQHEMDRTRPPAVAPAAQSFSAAPPADAIVLFDGRDLSAFVTGPANAPTAPGWKVENGYMEVVPRSGALRTKESFGDVQLHLEWATPTPAVGTGQDRGNSGIILMGLYEIQVLDSYQRADTYADGQAGAIYGQYPPLVNASRAPGEWQTYDILFRRPRFRADGTVAEPARATVIQNGVLVQNNEIIYGPTAPPPPYAYVRHADALPLTIQDHSHPVRFRNIWIRRIAERPEPGPSYVPAAVTLSPAQLRGMAGSFYRAPRAGGQQGAAAAPASPVPAYSITVQGNEIMVRSRNGAPQRAIAMTPDRLWLTGSPEELVLTRDSQGVVTAVNAADSRAEPATRR